MQMISTEKDVSNVWYFDPTEIKGSIAAQHCNLKRVIGSLSIDKILDPYLVFLDMEEIEMVKRTSAKETKGENA